MNSENGTGSACGYRSGILPECAPLAFPYIPFQQSNTRMYGQGEGLSKGTLFPGLNLPYQEKTEPHGELANNALTELMALGFAIVDLGLYLDTHREDTEALELYTYYVKLYQESRASYEKLYGPIVQTNVTMKTGYTWLNDPWPWERTEGGAK
ncbi:spore coat protein CotJB [Papillibacter cinnamivorans]|uniref:Spore coat protein JB n=1 Tax=Papillibacter cinnamivorans DSM 12816 TaxID=1122930 RepID=A0A1W1ZQU7_9FIRM|nr:spore coat protein CotJB [Papillibacter cinnamivorans]SMC50478.1 spore coat protein JB [Papillibacter cinnamivorans DSM 12816]